MLTISQIERATPPAKGRIVLWDGKLPGFGCRVFPSGQRSFILRYRLPGSRQKLTATLGTYGLVTLPQARKRADRAEQGVDIAVLDSLLNHAASGTRGAIVAVYQKATLIQPMRELMKLWDALIGQALADGKESERRKGR